jgi:hypothetical protein
MPEILWEGERDIRCDIIAVGTSLGGELTVYSEVVEILPNGDKKETLINNTDGIITMDDSTLNNNYVTFNVKESSRQFTYLYTTVKYLSEENIEYSSIFTSKISKRIYPKSLEIITAQDSFTNTIKNNMSLLYTPESINDTNIDGRGLFNVKWEIIDGSGEYEKIVIHDNDKEIAQIQAMVGVDAIVTVKASVIRIFDNEILCETQKVLEFKDINTIVTVISNEPLYTILVEHGIIKEIDGYGKLNRNDASKISMEDLVLKKYTEINKPTDTDNTNTLTLSSIPNEKQENYKYIKVNNKYYKWGGTSIFQNNKTLKSFVEFEWFNNSTVGQKPIEGSEAIFTPDNMFKGCSSLEEIALSDHFKYTANGMFEDCTSLKSIYGASQGKMDDNGNLIYTELSIEDIGANFAKNCSNLVVCVLSQMVTHIGINAFANCIKLTNFEVPSNKILKIDYDNSSTPFTGCYNINFTGSLYEDTSDIKIRVKDNACYEIIDDYTVRLIHMGKDSLVSNIPIDKTVYACAHSMEYRSSEIEPDIIVPSNIIFDGDRIFNNSNGNSIRLECLLTSNCHYLFFNTKYNGNYTFAYGETKIPQRCFSNSSDFEKIILPEGIKHIYSGAFYGCGSLKEIILPSTLNEIETQVFWLTNLQKITFNSEYPPILQKDLFYGNMPEAIYVNPEFYENFKNGIYQLYSPFVTPIKLYNEGYVRIIKDGNIVFLDEDNIVKVGNIDVTQVDDYMKYVTEQNIVDLKVYLNNEVIGEISDKYTTIYLGDNSSLFSGDGYNFRYGVYNDTIQSQLNENGWFYDKRFEGIRSNPNINSSVETEISLILENYLNKLMPIKYGMYSQLSSNQYGYGYFKNSNKEIILKNTVLGYNIENTITTTDGNAIVGFYGDITKTGINGIVLHEMGESIYSDPIINSVNMLINDENMFKFINVNLIASHEIPNNVYVTLTDNKSHIYRKLWENEIITFVVPNGYDFVVYASDFITENGKEYFIPNEILVEDNNINLVYETKKGIEIKNNILGYYTNDTDWYVNLDLLSGEWGDVNIPEVSTSEILLSDSNGLTNTEIISKINTDSIFENSINFNKFEKGVKGYIPSYIELEIFNQYLPEINEFLHDNGRNILNTEKLWVSESFDETNAWCSDGNIYPKTTVLNYYIFGKKIMF